MASETQRRKARHIVDRGAKPFKDAGMSMALSSLFGHTTSASNNKKNVENEGGLKCGLFSLDKSEPLAETLKDFLKTEQEKIEKQAAFVKDKMRSSTAICGFPCEQCLTLEYAGQKIEVPPEYTDFRKKTYLIVCKQYM